MSVLSTIFILALAFQLACLEASLAQPVPPRKAQQESRLDRSRGAPFGPVTSVPAGWVDFCSRNHEDCDSGPGLGAVIDLDPATREEIESVNAWVNKTITPVSDAEAWGVADHWDYPVDGKGDCEDFVLLKRRLLVTRAFPVEALLLTVVKDSRNDGHAVLMVRTRQGDFILDNLNDEMKPWDETGYRFVKRQSQYDQNLWVQLGEPTAPPEFVSR